MEAFAASCWSRAALQEIIQKHQHRADDSGQKDAIGEVDASAFQQSHFSYRSSTTQRVASQ
jgi:hypothetical protein